MHLQICKMLPKRNKKKNVILDRFRFRGFSLHLVDYDMGLLNDPWVGYTMYIIAYRVAYMEWIKIPSSQGCPTGGTRLASHWATARFFEPWNQVVFKTTIKGWHNKHAGVPLRTKPLAIIYFWPFLFQGETTPYLQYMVSISPIIDTPALRHPWLPGTWCHPTNAWCSQVGVRSSETEMT